MNAGSNNVFGLVRRLVARRASVPLLAPLLVVALLLCHGAAGGLHQAGLEPPAEAAHALPSEGHSAQHPAEHSPSHAGYVAYLAAFFAALLGVLIRPPVGMAGGRLPAPPATLRVTFATPPLCRELAPTAPSLQVFRL